jgi:hypothetical protein
MSKRPTTLKEVAAQSASLSEFGLNLRDWLHELRRASSRNQAAAAIAEEPPPLRERFAEGAVAMRGWGHMRNTWRNGSASRPQLGRSPRAHRAGARLRHRRRKPGAADTGARLCPAAFKRRNIFTPSVDPPLRLRAGRPKNRGRNAPHNAARQRRFRAARQKELSRLRKSPANSARKTLRGCWSR